MKSFYDIIPTKIGELMLICTENAVTSLELVKGNPVNLPAEITRERTPLMEQAIAELTEYFDGMRTVFTVPVKPEGTEFQRKVWKALCAIPYGETRSYKEIAAAVGNPNACRAVGMANHNNPVMILIPCHRVIGTNGSLTGYAGGVGVKAKLLALERQYTK